MTLTPTDEQQAIIDAYRAGQQMVIQARAGTGKTSTLKMLASAAPGRSGIYIAYNRAIATDAARSFPRNVECRTAHSLAFRAIGHQYKKRLDGPRQPARIVAQLLGVRPLRIDASLMLSETQVARIMLDTVARFCQSADPEITRWHVPFIEGITDPEARARLRDTVVPLARKAWADLSQTEGRLKFQHDHYLKLWQLQGPKLDVDVVMLDEAQDANPLIADIVERQTHAQRVMVGDAAQSIYCQPAGTMVRVPVKVGGQVRRGGPSWDFQERPIEALQVGDRVVSYSQSGQFGAIRKKGCAVTGVTRRPWHGPLKAVTTPSGNTSAYTPDHHCIVMLGDALRGQFVVYLARRGEHYRVGSCEGRYVSQGDAFGPLLRARQEGADAIWVLSTHPTRRTALAEEALTQTFHNIPGRCFLSEGGADYWKARPSNRQAAADLLRAFGLSIDAPLLDLRDQSLRSDQKGIHTWRTPFVTQARNLLDGMWVLLADRTIAHSRSATVRVSSWEPVKVTDEWFDGEVISISVDGDHTYIADGIATHNSWNGAVDAMTKFDPAAPRLYLSESFRFGPAIAEEANKWLGILGENPKLTGRARHTSVVRETGSLYGEPDAILCRTNAGAVGELMAAADDGKRAALVGGGDAIKRLAEAARELQRGVPTSHPELIAFQTWGQVRDYCLASETRLLTTDLRWQRIDLLEPGDKLVGFDEELRPGNPSRRFRTVTVESTQHIVRPSYRVTMSDGVSVVASEEHRWLVCSGNNLRWKQTRTMIPGDRIISIGRWDEEHTKDAGWLAGLFDGEGCVTGYPTARGRTLAVSQMEGPVLERARTLLKERGFAFGDYRNGHGVRQLYVRGELAEQLRLLGTIRPERLVAKAHQLWEERRVRVGRVATVASVEPVGDREVVAIRTDRRTFIAEGLLSHNCDQESAGSDLKVFVKLIDDHGADTVIATMDRLVGERYAQVVVSTAHKAKGREWDRVRVAGDFREPKGEDASVSPDEAMLAYVTVTRAKRVLDRGGLAWVDGWIAGQPAPAAEQLVLEDLDEDDLDDYPPDEEIDREERREEAKHLATSDEDYIRRVEEIASEVSTVTPAGFQRRRGAVLIEGRRPRTWLDDAIAAEHEITRQMGLLNDPKPAKGVATSA